MLGRRAVGNSQPSPWSLSTADAVTPRRPRAWSSMSTAGGDTDGLLSSGERAPWPISGEMVWHRERNEMYGDWQLGHMPREAHPQKHNEFASAMRAVAPDIRLVAVGNVGAWSEGMLARCAGHMDLIRADASPRMELSSMMRFLESEEAQSQARVPARRQRYRLPLAFVEPASRMAG